MSLQVVNIHDAKTNLSKLIEQASKGEAFIIAKAGKPMVRVESVKPKSRLGALRGICNVPDDFNTLMADEIETLFNGCAE